MKISSEQREHICTFSPLDGNDNNNENENENDNDYENENGNENDNVIKRLNIHFHEIIDKSKSFEDQIKLLRKVKNLKLYYYTKDYCNNSNAKIQNL